MIEAAVCVDDLSVGVKILFLCLVLWSVSSFYCSGEMSTLIGRGAVKRAQEKNLETHSASCIP